MKVNNILKSVGVFITMLVLIPSVAFAAVPEPDKIELKVPLGQRDNFRFLENITVPNLISGGISFLLITASVVFFFILVIGGIQWIVSGGDKTGAENARKKITNALIGLAIVFIAWAIIRLVSSVFGVDIITNLTTPKVYDTTLQP